MRTERRVGDSLTQVAVEPAPVRQSCQSVEFCCVSSSYQPADDDRNHDERARQQKHLAEVGFAEGG